MTVEPPVNHGSAWMVALIFGSESPQERIKKRDEWSEWCDVNTAGFWWSVTTKYVYFRAHDDAMLFYLRYR